MRAGELLAVFSLEWSKRRQIENSVKIASPKMHRLLKPGATIKREEIKKRAGQPPSSKGTEESRGDKCPEITLNLGTVPTGKGFFEGKCQQEEGKGGRKRKESKGILGDQVWGV